MLLVGNGLLGTLLAVRGTDLGFDNQTIGLIMSCYFAGFLLGTLWAPSLIRRVGHVRVFAFHAALACAACLVLPIWSQALVWMLMRVIAGVALAGMCTVAESWLSARASPDERGRVFAIYMVTSLGAMALGQMLLGLQAPGGFVLFNLAAILTALAILPISLTLLPQPVLEQRTYDSPMQIVRKVPTAAIGAVASGLVMGAFWGMAPVYAASRGLDRASIGVAMGVTVCGGAALQWPIGRLSDRGDRRLAIAAVCALAALVALAVKMLQTKEPALLLGLCALYGGLAFSLYPLCVAYLLDRLPPESLLGGCSTLLFLTGVGATLGPALSGQLMHWLGPSVFPVILAATLATMAVVAAGRRLLRARISLDRVRFRLMLRTTPVALELLRAWPGNDKEEKSP